MMVEAGAVQVLGATLLPSNTQQPVRLWSPSWVPGCLSINASDEISDSCDGDRKIAAVIVLCSCVESPPAQNNAVSAFSVDQVTIPACKLVGANANASCCARNRLEAVPGVEFVWGRLQSIPAPCSNRVV